MNVADVTVVGLAKLCNRHFSRTGRLATRIGLPVGSMQRVYREQNLRYEFPPIPSTLNIGGRAVELEERQDLMGPVVLSDEARNRGGVRETSGVREIGREDRVEGGPVGEAGAGDPGVGGAEGVAGRGEGESAPEAREASDVAPPAPEPVTIPGFVESITKIEGRGWVVRIRLTPGGNVALEFVATHYPMQYHETFVADEKQARTYFPGDPAAIVGYVVPVGQG